ncbi:MAG: hypothetical protein JRG67_04735 [Deltaproteobacteria bacterium]|nr:hypothetical protein [Deltaproteobacteria bacterium]MBW2210342.1 hypothetical protein [Deltaproteobacteria bacterium]MBW2379247.1 hypothetical protein [Deltaproteobacteria bacterium]MBW2686445.1 hypothetical protein [Deltaproteobacteria bacterium]
MFRPKKTIPKLAVAMLALTGCGGDGGTGGTGGTAGNGGTGGGDGGNFDASLSAFCMNVASCFGYTAQECTNYYNNVMPNYYDIDSECEAALISYFDCGASKTCNEVLAGACDDLYDAVFYEHCTPLQ